MQNVKRAEEIAIKVYDEFMTAKETWTPKDAVLALTKAIQVREKELIEECVSKIEDVHTNNPIGANVNDYYEAIKSIESDV